MSLGAYTRTLRQSATYWGPSTQDEFGQVSWDAPILIPCRWQDKPVLFTSPEGAQILAQSQVYTLIKPVNQGFLYLGDATGVANPQFQEGAKEIKQVYATVDLGNNYSVIKSML